MKNTIKTIKGKVFFNSVFSQGKKVVNESIIAIYKKNNAQEHYFYYSVAVSKKVSKKAVIRNRMKRLLRESLRIYNNIYGLPSISIIFIWRNKVNNIYDYNLKTVMTKTNQILKDIEEI